METHKVASSMIHHLDYDQETQTLDVCFNGKLLKPGAVYRYPNVTPEEVEALAGAESVGKHFNEHFRGKREGKKQ